MIAARRGVIPQDYQTWCDYFKDVLKDIADGDLSVPLPSGVFNLPQSNTENQEKVFTRSKFDSDGNLLNEEETGSLDVP